MKLPNFASVAILMGLVVFLETLAAGAEDASSALWIPAAVLVVSAVAKGLQVFIQNQQAANGPAAMSLDGQPGAVKRWLLD